MTTMHTSHTNQLNMEKIAFDNAMRSLDSNYREVLILVCAKQLGYDEVSELLHIPVASVRDRLSQGRRALQDLMDMPVRAKHNQPAPPPIYDEMPPEKMRA